MAKTTWQIVTRDEQFSVTNRETKRYADREDCRRMIAQYAAQLERQIGVVRLVSPSAAEYRAHHGYDSIHVRYADGRFERIAAETAQHHGRRV